MRSAEVRRSRAVGVRACCPPWGSTLPGTLWEQGAGGSNPLARKVAGLRTLENLVHVGSGKPKQNSVARSIGLEAVPLASGPRRRIPNSSEDNGEHPGCLFGGQGAGRVCGRNDINFERNQCGAKRGEALERPRRNRGRAVLERRPLSGWDQQPGWATGSLFERSWPLLRLRDVRRGEEAHARGAEELAPGNPSSSHSTATASSSGTREAPWLSRTTTTSRSTSSPTWPPIRARRSLHPLSPLTEGARATSCPMWSSGSISGIAPPPPERRRAWHGACERGGRVDRAPAGFALDSQSALHHSRGPGGGVT